MNTSIETTPTPYLAPLLERLLKDRGVGSDAVALVGGAALAVFGLRPNKDLDFVAADEGRRALVGCKPVPKDGGYLVADEVDLKIDWARCVGVSDEQIVSDERYHLKTGAFKVARMELVFAVKVRMARPHDRKDIALIESSLDRLPGWDWELVRRLLSAAEARRVRGPWATRFRKIRHRFKWKAIRGGLLRSTPRRLVAGLRHLLQQVEPSGWEPREGPTPLASSRVRMQSVVWMPTGALLGMQFRDGEFVRHDVFVRCLAARAIDAGDDSWRPIYDRMQTLRVGASHYDVFARLVRSVRDHGMLARHPIPITEEGVLFDGAHRLACALHFGVKDLPVVVVPQARPADYGRGWFVEKGFAPEALAQIDGCRSRIMRETGVWFSVVLWPPVAQYHDEISDWLRERHRVVWELDAEWGGRFPELVRQIYATDDIEPWKVELKLHCMRPHGTKVRVLALEIPEPRFRPKGVGAGYLSIVGEDLKAMIRGRYKARVPDYFYDIICHIGDNHHQNRDIFALAEAAGGADRLTR